jgi:hypothetical protein
MFLVTASIISSHAQVQAKPNRIWSIGPLVSSEPVMGFAFGAGGATLTGPHVDSQTQSIFAATRSVAFAGDRVIIATRTGMRQVEGAQAPASVYQVLSLDAKTGLVKDNREFSGFGSVEVFATSDDHVIVWGRKVLRLKPDLSDDGSFDYQASGHKFGRIQNISPDGTTLGNATSPGFELVDARTLERKQLTPEPAVDTSVSSKGFITDNVHWIRDYPKDLSFVTYTDVSGEHLLYHGRCGGRPQFLTDLLVLEPGCKNPLIIDTSGTVVRTLPVTGAVSFAGVSRNGKRFALQTGKFTGSHTLKSEQFVIYSAETGEPVAEVGPDTPGQEQSWTAFSPDGSLFVVGSPLKLTLYRLP